MFRVKKENMTIYVEDKFKLSCMQGCFLCHTISLLPNPINEPLLCMVFFNTESSKTRYKTTLKRTQTYFYGSKHECKKGNYFAKCSACILTSFSKC